MLREDQKRPYLREQQLHLHGSVLLLAFAALPAATACPCHAHTFPGVDQQTPNTVI